MKLKFKIIILCVICFIIFIGAIVADKIINKSNLVELSYNEVIESLQEQEEKVEEIDYQLDLSEDDE